MDSPRIGAFFAFSTARLEVDEWHRHEVDGGLVPFVVSLLTPAVTRPLPPAWQGSYSLDRVEKWITERDEDGPTLLVVERARGRPVGLFILHVAEAELPGSFDLRLGYMLAEDAWRKGFGAEMMAGFVDSCRAHPQISSVLAGVEADNLASVRILERNGFERVSADETADELEYRLLVQL
jgi:ribosomal-protein-alanine N-acetyltransferase